MTRSDLERIIEQAINDEIESYEFYKDASNKVIDKGLKDVFNRLSKEELEHKNYLEDFLKSNAKTINIIPSEDYGISQTIEEEPELTCDMNFIDAMKLAVKKEEIAMKNYEKLANSCDDEQIKNIFIGLKNMEQMHKNDLENIYLNAANTETW